LRGQSPLGRRGGFGGFARNLDGMCGRNRDEKNDGSGGMRAAAPPMKRETGGRTLLATWLKKRLSFGRKKREPLSVRVVVAASRDRPWQAPLRALSGVLQLLPGARGQTRVL